MIGQVEIDSLKYKSLKADYYVMNAGECILQSMSNTVHKTALKSVSSIGQEVKFNSKVTVITPDKCPIIGKSNNMSNIVFNFGASQKMFVNEQNMLEYYALSAELTAKIVLDDLGLEPFKPTEKESKLL